MNNTSIAFAVIGVVSIIVAIVSAHDWSEAPVPATPPAKIDSIEVKPEPEDGSFRIVKMSNGKYRVETYYKASFWHAVGGPDNCDLSLELAQRVYESLTSKREEPSITEIIK